MPISSVQFTHGFWADWLELIKRVTLPTQYELLEDTGRLDNFRRCKGEEAIVFKGYYFNDSDVYKWLEAACWLLSSGLDDQSQSQLDEIISLISLAQEENGYLNTYFSREKTSERWNNLRDMHELYCSGHFIQTAIAHFRVTGADDCLGPAVKLADHICRRFMRSRIDATPGHPEIEMALVELFRTTRDARYLEMAKLFLDQRGYGQIGGDIYHLDHMPFRELKQLGGHAVRALYLCCGAADIYLETGEPPLLRTLEYLWERMVSYQLYISGGAGSRYAGESFGDEFELPNARSYAETCAAVASFMWSWRMLHCTGDVRYTDLMEWTLFNAVLPGIGLGGATYHYANPLEVYDVHARQIWFECACCPTNVVRLLASLAGYFYSHYGNNIWIHHYTSNAVQISLENDLVVRLSIETDYPWDGEICVKFITINRQLDSFSVGKAINTGDFEVNLRIPGWLSSKIPVYINNELWREYGNPATYLKIQRMWKIGDTIKLNFPLQLRYLESHPFVYENINRVAVSKGPLLYCIEAYDNPNTNPREIFLSLDHDSEIQPLPDLPMKVDALLLKANQYKPDDRWMNQLYLEAASTLPYVCENSKNVIALPYFAWGNRANGWMRVWLQRSLEF